MTESIEVASHKQMRARAHWQLVYQIYLPALDTLVTGMTETPKVGLKLKILAGT